MPRHVGRAAGAVAGALRGGSREVPVIILAGSPARKGGVTPGRGGAAHDGVAEPAAGPGGGRLTPCRTARAGPRAPRCGGSVFGHKGAPRPHGARESAQSATDRVVRPGRPHVKPPVTFP
nr:hypothetical protein StreXyl84_24080 [Streptomyces sp. Xyl84]